MRRSLSTFKRRSGGRRRSFGPRIKAAKAPGRYQTSDFYIESQGSFPAGSATEQVLAFNLATISLSLQQDPTNPGRTTGIVLGNLMRKIEIGGVVFDYGIECEGEKFASDDGITKNQQLMAMFGLVYDELDTLVGSQTTIPNFVNNWSPWTSGFPIAIYNPNSDTPKVQTAEPFRPLRILWRKAESLNLGMQRVANTDEGSLYVPAQQYVRTRTGTVNRRLRVSLDNQQGLFLFFATRNNAAFEAHDDARIRRVWFQGQLYWRFRT